VSPLDGMTANDLLNMIALRDAEDSLTRAVGWTVAVSHVESPEMLTLYGNFSDPAPALVWAHEFAAGLNVEGETGFRCVPTPILPAGDEA
jgi:hypothetical protein